VQRQGPRIIGTTPMVSRSDDDGAFLFTQREIVRSTPVLAIALNNLGDLKTFHGERNRFTFLRKELGVEVGKKDELITVSMQSANPDEATKIVAAVVDGYLEFQTKQKRSTAADVLNILRDEKNRRETELDQRVRTLQEFRKTQGLLSTDADKAQVMLERLKSLSDALNAARVETLNAKAAYEDCSSTIMTDSRKAREVTELRYSSSFSVLSPADEQLIRTELFSYEARLHDAKRQYGINHPSVRLLQGRVDQLQVTYAAAVVRRYDQAKSKEADLAALLEKQQQEAIVEQNKAAEYARLQSEVDRVQKQLDLLDGRMKEVNFADDTGAPSITVLEPARAEDKPTFPSASKTLALAMMVGLVSGMGFACIRDRHDYPLKSARQIRQALGTRVIGLIPRMTKRGRVLETDPSSDVAESCRALYNVIADSISPNESKTILVTSPSRGDGKSTLAVNLAAAMAQQGKRVLLVDADFRSPSLQRIFNLRGKEGLSNLLGGQDVPGSIVHDSGVAGLEILPCGTLLGNPLEMLNSERFTTALEYLIDRYDHIVLDAPPTVPVDDARIIAASCDITLLVLRAGRANRRLAEMARDGLGAVGAKIMGVVVNDVDRQSYAKYDGVYEDGPVSQAAARTSDAADDDFDVQLRAMLSRRPTPHFNTSSPTSATKEKVHALDRGLIEDEIEIEELDHEDDDR
jgi:capsular exopolysaccharide synthesis family protein